MRFVDSIEDFEDSIYIFGIGVIGELLYQYLKKKDVKIISFVCSHSGELSTFHGKPVISADEIKDDIQVIIATLLDLHDEIENYLVENGINNFGAVSECFIETMRLELIDKSTERASLILRIGEMEKLSYKREIIDAKVISDNAIVSEICEDVCTSKEYLEQDDNSKKVLFIVSVSWKNNWKELIKKAFDNVEKIYISFRYKYMNLSGFSIVERAKKSGFQLTSTRRFYRDSKEFNTEDVLLLFEKRHPSSLNRDALCMGCGLCELNCPSGAIQMKENDYGYKKPYINKELCVECNKCIYECPVYVDNSQNVNPKTYAFMGNDKIRKHSSSGGAFGTLAKVFLEKGGIVCGAAWKTLLHVEHIIISDICELEKVQMSKYIRSDIRTVLAEIKKELDDGERDILFSGCPCQVAALKKYLGKDYARLHTIDLVCSEAPSSMFFEKYLRENYDIDEIAKVGFREKSDGWRPDSFTVYKKDGTVEIRHIEDISQQAFHSRMMMDVACEHCNYVRVPREGDVSIGDAWGVPERDSSLDDKKGTSIVTINTKKGNYLLEILRGNNECIKEIPFEWTFNNRTSKKVQPYARRDLFYRKIKDSTFYKAFYETKEEICDVGIVGIWSYPNYGSQITYYALYQTIKDMGFSVLMIEWPQNSLRKPYGYASLFQHQPYMNEEIAHPAKDHLEMREYNKKCQMFVLGSDQMINPFLYHAIGEMPSLDWCASNKKKIGYALSHGSKTVEYLAYDKDEISYYLKRFDTVSVREDYAVDSFRENFNIYAQRVLDPVFLCDIDKYKALASSYIDETEKQMFAYILDMNNEISESLKALGDCLGTDCFVISDAEKIQGRPNCLIEKWLAKIIKCKYMITDSFHGMCMAILFNKQFVAIKNMNRGGERFDSLLGLFGLKGRLIQKGDYSNMKNILFEKIDYNRVMKILETEKARSKEWLYNALNKEHISIYDEKDFMYENLIRIIKERTADRD